MGASDDYLFAFLYQWLPVCLCSMATMFICMLEPRGARTGGSSPAQCGIYSSYVITSVVYRGHEEVL